MISHEQISKTSQINKQKQDDLTKINKQQVSSHINEVLDNTDHKISSKNNVINNAQGHALKRPKYYGKNLVTADRNRKGQRSFNYPAQDYNNCFACAGSAIYNRLVNEKNSSNKLDQYKVRNFVPYFLDSNELASHTKESEDKESWMIQVKEILEYSGNGKTGFGDFFSLSDVIHEKKANGGLGRKDIAVHKMIFQLKDQQQDKVDAQVEIIKEKLHKILEKNQMAMIRAFDHYLTITGLDDDTITFLDSRSDLINTRDTTKETSMDIHKFLKKCGDADGYDTTELTWVTRITPDSRQALFNEFKDMGQDEKTGQIVRKTAQNIGADDVSHRAGIVIVKSPDQLENEGYGDVSGMVSEYIAIHRYVFSEEPKQEKKLDRKRIPDDYYELVLDEKYSKLKKTKQKKEQNKSEKKAEKKEPVKEEKKEQKEQDKENKEVEEKQENKGTDPLVIARQEKILETFEKGTRSIFSAHSKTINKTLNRRGQITIPTAEMATKYDRKWNREKRSEAETDSKILNTSSELYRKAAFAKRLEAKIKENADRSADRRKGMSNSARSLVEYEDLKEISSFFTGDMKALENLITLVSGKLSDEKGVFNDACPEVKKKMHYAALDIMTEQLINLSVNGIDLSSDEGILNNFDRLFDLSQKISAYRKLLDKEPDYFKERKKNYSEGDYAAVSKRLRTLSVMEDYFTARCTMLRHPVYLRRYDREIGVIFTDVDSNQEKEFSKLLLCMRSAARRLKLSLGRDESKKYGNLKKGLDDGKDSFDDFLAFYEQQEKLGKKIVTNKGLKQDLTVFSEKSDQQRRVSCQRRGMYSEKGGIDYSDCKAERVNNFMGSLSDFLRSHGKLKKKDVLENSRFFSKSIIGTAVDVADLFDMYRKIHSQNAGGDYSALVEEGYLSSKELIELKEGLNLSGENNKVLTKDRQDLYLSSVSALIKSQFDLANRFLQTYGRFPEQLSQPLFISVLTGKGNGAEFTDRLLSAAKLSELTHKTIAIDGKEKSVLDELVDRNLLGRPLADKIKGTADLIDCYKNLCEGGIDSMVNLAVEKNDEDEENALAKLSEENYVRTRALSDYYTVGHRLSVKEYSEQSVILRKIGADHKKYFEGYEKGRIRTTKEQYLRKLLLFDARLRGVEAGKRSGAYNSFSTAFRDICLLLIDIEEKGAEDGKCLDPESVVKLRRLYDDCIKKADRYLAGKTIRENIHEGVNTDQDRYRMTRDIRNLMDRDLGKLLSLDYDKNYSFEEAFSDKRNGDDLKLNKSKEEVSSFIIADALGINKERIGLKDLSEDEGDIIRQISDNNVLSYIIGKAELPGEKKENGGLKAAPSPADLLIIDEKTASRIVHMEKNYLFFKLGPAMTIDGKNSLWNRIETMKKEILAAMTEGQSKNLQIITREGFNDLSLNELAKASGGTGLFADVSRDERYGERFEDKHKKGLAFRFECTEQKVSANVPRLVAGNNEAFVRSLFDASRQFDEKIGSLFNATRTSDAIGNPRMNYDDSKAVGFMAEHLDAFCSKEYKEYGIDSVADLFYIDGKRAKEVLGAKAEEYTRSVAGRFSDKVTGQQLMGIKDMAFKALIMSCLTAGDKQITLANFQIQNDGSVVPVVTDLDTGAAIISKSRKSRQQRFRDIRKDMYAKKTLAYENISKQIKSQREVKAGYAAFDEAAEVFLENDDKKRSDEFKTLKRAILQFYRVIDDPANVELNEKTYPVILKAYNAASHYHAKHVIEVFGKGYHSQAARIMKFLSKIAEKATCTRLADQIENPKNVTAEEKYRADLNIVDCAESYFHYCNYVSRDTIATEPEKLTKKWEMLKQIERDIQIVSKLSPNRVKDYIAVKALVDEYKMVKLNMALLKQEKNTEGMENALSNYRSKFIAEKSFEISGSKRKSLNKDHSEYGITNTQMMNLRQIDQWLIRNFRNGGYMRAFGLHTDRSNILSEIMKKTPRERLYIYYIVENSQARKRPNPYDASVSQLYTPSLATFKKSMVAHWLKFYSRFSGGYVYWHKLSQALAICEGYGDVIDSMDDYYRQIKEERESDAKNENKAVKEKVSDEKADQKGQDGTDQLIDEFQDSLSPIITILLKIQILEEQQKEKKIDAGEFDKKMAKLGKKLGSYNEKIKNLPSLKPIMLEDLKKRKIKTDAENKTSVEKGLQEAKEIGDNIKYMGTIGCLTEAISSFDFLKGGFSSFMKSYGSASEKGIGSIGSVIGCIFTVKDLLKNWKIIRKMDRVQNISGMSINVARLAQTVITYTASSRGDGTFAGAVLGTTAGLVLATGDAAVTGFKAWSHYKNGEKRIEASKLASRVRDKERVDFLETGVKKDQRYHEGIVRLNRLIGKKQKIETGSSILGTTASVLAALSLVTGFITGPLITVPAIAINLLSSFGTIKWTSHVTKEMRREIGAAFFDAQEMIRVAKKDYLNEYGQPMSQKQEEKLRKVILKRIAASHGYYSPSHMANAVAINFAKYLLEGAKNPGDEGRMCVDMIRGFGLKVTLNPLTRAVISPTASDIAKKMCG